MSEKALSKNVSARISMEEVGAALLPYVKAELLERLPSDVELGFSIDAITDCSVIVTFGEVVRDVPKFESLTEEQKYRPKRRNRFMRRAKDLWREYF